MLCPGIIWGLATCIICHCQYWSINMLLWQECIVQWVFGRARHGVVSERYFLLNCSSISHAQCNKSYLLELQWLDPQYDVLPWEPCLERGTYPGAIFVFFYIFFFTQGVPFSLYKLLVLWDIYFSPWLTSLIHKLSPCQRRAGEGRAWEQG